MIFAVPATARPRPWPIVLGHYLPWFTQDDPNRHPVDKERLADLVIPQVEPWRHWRDSRSQYRRTHLFQPCWGEYDSRDKEIIRRQIGTAREHGLDGFVVNLYGKNSVENLLGLSFLQELETYNRTCPEDPFVYMVSLDAQAQWPTEGKTPVSIEEDFAYLRDVWFGKYCLRRDGVPCLAVFVYDRPAREYRQAADRVFGEGGLDLLWPGCDHADDANAAYAWVRPDRIEPDGSWFEPDNPGDQWLHDYYRQCNACPQMQYIMGGVWPGFNDQLVSWAWNPHPENPKIRPRVMCRESTRGNTLRLTWAAAEEYICQQRQGVNGCRLPMPLVQVVTWNDWAEATNVEPDCDSGHRALDICKEFSRRLKC